MSRSTKILLAVLAALVALFTYWLVGHFEQVEVTKREAPGREARRNPYLAFERFVKRYGHDFTTTSDPQSLDKLPANGVLVLDHLRAQHMPKARADRLLAWVENGGYLIVVPEAGDTPDTVVDRFGVQWKDTEDLPFAPADDEPAAGTDEAKPAEAAPETDQATQGNAPKSPAPMPKTIRFSLPGSTRQLSMNFNGYVAMEATEPAPAWTAGDPNYGAMLLHYTRGKGNVTVVAHLDGLADNEEIGQHDHAEIVFELLNRYQPKGPITLLTRLHMPSLWEWLGENAQAALWSFLVLFALWLWRIMPRFGLLRPDPVPEHRALREQLAAIGRFVWRAGGFDHWLAVERRAFRALLALRHPAMAALPPEELIRALANHSSRPQLMIANALENPARNPLQFTEALRTLQQLERSLR